MTVPQELDRKEILSTLKMAAYQKRRTLPYARTGDICLFSYFRKGGER